jgi:hypothetical protein
LVPSGKLPSCIPSGKLPRCMYSINNKWQSAKMCSIGFVRLIKYGTRQVTYLYILHKLYTRQVCIFCTHYLVRLGYTKSDPKETARVSHVTIQFNNNWQRFMTSVFFKER